MRRTSLWLAETRMISAAEDRSCLRCVSSARTSFDGSSRLHWGNRNLNAHAGASSERGKQMKRDVR